MYVNVLLSINVLILYSYIIVYLYTNNINYGSPANHRHRPVYRVMTTTWPLVLLIRIFYIKY